MPHDPQNANPGAIGLPQLVQMTSAEGAGAPPARPGITLPIAGVPPPLETPPRATAGDGPPAKVLAGGGACEAGGDCKAEAEGGDWKAEGGDWKAEGGD